VTGLVLRPVDVAGPLSWTWQLLDAGNGTNGTPLAGHQVRIDPAAWQFQAFADLGRYLQVNVDPARRLADEARIVEAVGAWAAGLLGDPIMKVIVSRAPVTVAVEVPDGLGLLPAWPWELAHAGGVPLARLGATLVYDLVGGGQDGGPSEAPGQVPAPAHSRRPPRPWSPPWSPPWSTRSR
jgi:hypothetical protein